MHQEHCIFGHKSDFIYTHIFHKNNEEILSKLKPTSILDKITSYETEWIQHVNQMPRSRLPNLFKKYEPRGKRNQGIPLKRRLLDERDQNRPAMAYFPENEMMMTHISYQET
jgi:hypothetical protein